MLRSYRARTVGGRISHDDRSLLDSKSGSADACAFGTLSFVREREAVSKFFESIDLQGRERGWSSNNGRGSNPLPARSNGLDDIDGGPDAGLYIQLGII